VYVIVIHIHIGKFSSEMACVLLIWTRRRTRTCTCMYIEYVLYLAILHSRDQTTTETWSWERTQLPAPMSHVPCPKSHLQPPASSLQPPPPLRLLDPPLSLPQLFLASLYRPISTLLHFSPLLKYMYLCSPLCLATSKVYRYTYNPIFTVDSSPAYTS